jgi:glucose-1-phosphate thymidylyltransferase
MKGLVLAGGTGTRLRPFTYSIPKQLMPVAGKPVLQYCLENIRDVGITEVGIIVGERDGQIERSVGDGADLGLRISYILQEAPLGLAHCVAVAADFLGQDDFLMYLGDNMVVGGLAEAARDFRDRRPAAKVLATKVDDPRFFGVVELDSDGRVLSLAEKPDHPRSDLAMMGVYFFTAAIHEAVRRIRPSARGELEITDAIQDLLAQGRTVVADVYVGYWTDTGSVDALLECHRVMLEEVESGVHGEVDEHSTLTGAVVVEPGATVVRSRLVGPLVVGAGSVITDCCLGPYASVGRGCTINGATVRDSIVLDHAEVSGMAMIHDSVIGRRALVRAEHVPGHRLLVGDQASVKVGA